MNKLALSCLAALALASPSAFAADLTQEPVGPVTPVSAQSDWRFDASVYGWLAGIDGDIGVRGYGPVGVTVSPMDAIKDLKGAFSGTFVASNGHWTFLGDLVWTKIGDDGPVGQTNSSYDFEQKQLIASGLVGYSLPIDVSNLKLSATVGFRYQHIDADVSINIPAISTTVSDGGTVDWVDPTVGLLMRYDFNEHWFLNALADIGGFGVGSNLTSQGFASVGYNWTKTFSTSLGYRAIYTDYESGGFVYNTTMQGVYAGAGFHF
jgi:hypothetical protein